jgi:2-(3-amino-3-carboxypropyl)histidine synthase
VVTNPTSGRFHLEAIMIANPAIPAFRYDPYGRLLTREEYAHGEMRAVRRRMVERARQARSFGIVLGTLGRQGNPAILSHLEGRMAQAGVAHTVGRYKCVVFSTQVFCYQMQHGNRMNSYC